MPFAAQKREKTPLLLICWRCGVPPLDDRRTAEARITLAVDFAAGRVRGTPGLNLLLLRSAVLRATVSLAPIRAVKFVVDFLQSACPR